MQITADEHVELLGYGGYAMADMGFSWVLIRTEVWIEEYPKYDEEYDIYTATGETRHGVYPRYFEMRRPDGTVTGKAMTLWVVFDMKTRAMTGESASGIKLEYAKKRNEIPPFPPVPRPLTEGERSVSRRTVRYSDLDMVGHMNNTHYIDWLSDAVPWSKFRDSQFSHILIGYNEETRPDTELELELMQNGDAFSFRDIREEGSHFVIRGEWKHIDPAF